MSFKGSSKLAVLLLVSLAMVSVGANKGYAAWTEMTGGIDNIFHNVWASSSSDVYAVGGEAWPTDDGILFHYDGSDWSGMTGPTLYGIWGSSGSDIFAVGVYGPNRIHHYDGHSWTGMSNESWDTLNSVWGASANDVFAVGAGGTIVHYEGDDWTAMFCGSTDHLNGVWGSSGDDVFAVGKHILPSPPYEGSIFHYDGSDWAEMVIPDVGDLTAVWGSSSTDVFAVGYYSTIIHYDGSSWTAMTFPLSDQMFTGVWGSSANDVFVVGWDLYTYQGIIIHYDGIDWTTMTSGIDHTFLGVYGVASNVYAVGGGIYPDENGAIFYYNNPNVPAPASWTHDDYNGDGTSDIAIFRGDSGLWSVRGVTRVYFGGSTDETVPGDYDGDGTTDIGSSVIPPGFGRFGK